jgi:methylamine dehydrogenase heavy chain
LAVAAWGQQFQPERVGVVPAITAKNRVYLLDIAINHIADGKLHIVDGDSLRYLGLIGTGFTGQTILSLDGREIIVATGYLSRGQRGERTDIVEVWDADTLEFKYEIPIPDKRAMAINYEGLVRLSSMGRWLFVQNATPATSVTVVDMEARTTVGEVPMPGCYGIYPSQAHPNRFASLCGDGTVDTVDLDNSGNVASRDSSQKLFDPDSDAWFVSGEQVADTYYFLSFKGNLTAVNIAGERAVVVGTWPLVTGADTKKSWRPGGYQPLAIQGNRIYVAMHPDGAEGSHKNPAAEIWAFDLKTKKRVARMKGSNAIALEASADGSKLYAIDPVKSSLVVYDHPGPKPKIRALQVGETAVQLVAP